MASGKEGTDYVKVADTKPDDIIAYTVGNELVVESNYAIKANTDMCGMFDGDSKYNRDAFGRIKSIDLHVVDVSDVTIMSNLFNSCKSLVSVNTDTWDTSNVTKLVGTFDRCASLKSIDLNHWNTSNVVNIACMFEYCEVLSDVHISEWDTSKVESSAQAFMGCHALQNIDLTKWDTHGFAYHCAYMFTDCPLDYICVGPAFNLNMDSDAYADAEYADLRHD